MITEYFLVSLFSCCCYINKKQKQKENVKYKQVAKMIRGEEKKPT